ncbi:uncharacterized protein FA14DRAFT_170608 [Meira miltonrushii]|uniref:Transcription factor BYE1 n=1 Tax=Meira miltonrushii TaxID=1280837 RepID=A0A316VJV0_9BASI|nr:uncharacterized protein FA14DRAFT_170608 [Meira miltonrushii]PWN37836.1 hypothetical protein FA14DRAFT_170608 [Meira miltonrushii]
MGKEADVTETSEETTRGSRYSSRLRKPSRKAVEEMGQAQDGVNEEKADSEKSGEKSIRNAAEEFCICRKGDDGKPMVLCANCNEWYHFKCIGLTKKAAESLTEFTCPSCVDDKQPSEVASAQDPEQSSNVPSASPKRKLQEADVVSKKARSQAPTLSPSRAQHANSSNVTKESSSANVQTSRKLSTSASSGSKSNTSSASAVQRSRSDALRKHAEEQFAAIFSEIMTEASENKQEGEEQSQEYAHSFEGALYEMTNESAINANFRIAGKAYRDKLRSFMFNLKDKTNITLRAKIADGIISAVELSNMSSEELANDARREEVERRKKESLEQSILKKDNAPLRKLTHKGEIDIEYENRLTEDQVHSSISVSNRVQGDEVSGKNPTGQSTEKDSQDDKLPAAKSSSSSDLPRRTSQSVQSPTLPFDFSNVWQGDKAPDENDEDVQAHSDQEHEDNQDGDISIAIRHTEEVDDDSKQDEIADDFIDDFLGMEEDGKGNDVQQSGQETTSQDNLPAIGWKGSIHMPDEGFFTCAVRQIAGRDLTTQDWTNLFPSPFSLIEGRLPSGSAIPYLLESRIAPRTELVALMAEPEFIPESMPEANKITDEDGNETSFDHLVKYFKGKDRYGVLQPLRSARGRAVKDFYMAALPKDQPIPEWLALLSPQCLSDEKAQRRGKDLFLLVGVLFRQDIPSQGAYRPGQPTSSLTPREGGGYTPDQSNSTGLGGGSSTLQDLLRAVGGNTRSNNTPPNLGGGGTPTSFPQPASVTQSGIVPPSSVQALSELPKPQLEDVLTKNPNLVEDLLRTLGKTASTAPAGPPGPPPARPPMAGYGGTPPYGQQGYGSNTAYSQNASGYQGNSQYQYGSNQNQYYPSHNNSQGYQQYGYGQDASQQYNQTPASDGRREYNNNNQNYGRGYQSGGRY